MLDAPITDTTDIADAIARAGVLSHSLGRVFARNLPTGRELLLAGTVGAEITLRGVADALDRLRGDIVVRINSGGGDVFEGFAIYNALKRYPGRKHVIVEAVAASMGSVIAMAGDHIEMPGNAFLMLHNPWGMAIGGSADMRKHADLLDRLKEPMIAAYATRSGKPADDIRAAMEAETWFTAAEAHAFGLCDGVTEALEAAAHADLTRFRNVPAALARRASHIGDFNMTTTTVADPRPATAATLAELKDIAARGKLGADFVLAQLEAGATVQAATNAVIDAMASKPDRPAAVTQILNERRPTEGMVDALVARMTGQIATGAAERFNNMSVADMAGVLLEANGTPVRSMTPGQRIDAAFGGGIRTAYAMHTTSDFPQLMLAAGQRVLLDAYEAARSPLVAVLAGTAEATDFRPVKALRMGNFPELLPVPEGGAIELGAALESGETIGLATFARRFSISRQALINDDLRAMADSARWAGAAAAELEAKTAVALLAQNSGAGPTLADGNPLFTTTRGNLAGSGTAIDATALSAGRLAMRTMKDLDGVTPISVAPKYLVVGPAKETQAEQVLATLSPTITSDVNPFSGKLELLVEPRLTGNQWFLWAPPSSAPVLEAVYLRGARQPDVAMKEGWIQLGTEIRVVHDFGFGAVGWRGAYRNPGA